MLCFHGKNVLQNCAAIKDFILMVLILVVIYLLEQKYQDSTTRSNIFDTSQVNLRDKDHLEIQLKAFVHA